MYHLRVSENVIDEVHMKNPSTRDSKSKWASKICCDRSVWSFLVTFTKQIENRKFISRRSYRLPISATSLAFAHCVSTDHSYAQILVDSSKFQIYYLQVIRLQHLMQIAFSRVTAASKIRCHLMWTSLSTTIKVAKELCSKNLCPCCDVCRPIIKIQA